MLPKKDTNLELILFWGQNPRFARLKPSLALRLLSKGLFYIRAMGTTELKSFNNVPKWAVTKWCNQNDLNTTPLLISSWSNASRKSWTKVIWTQLSWKIVHFIYHNGAKTFFSNFNPPILRDIFSSFVLNVSYTV